jgi:NADH-quinone oxidoreductase subunit N
MMVNGVECVYLSDLGRLRVINPLALFVVVATFFSFAGIPPFVGFYAKTFLILELFQFQYYVSVCFILVTSLISTLYYIRIIKTVVMPTQLELHSTITNTTSDTLLFLFFLFCLIGFSIGGSHFTSVCASVINSTIQQIFGVVLFGYLV